MAEYKALGQVKVRLRRATIYRFLSNFFDYGGTNGKNCVWDVHIRKSDGEWGV